MAFQLGIALGGGAAKGLAHLGVLKALEESGVQIDIVTGTSIGSIIGSIYAANPDAKATISKIDEYLSSEDFNRSRLDFIQKSDQETAGTMGQLKKIVRTGYFFARSLRNSSFISEKAFRENLTHIIPDQNIEDCKISLGLVSVSLTTGEKISFTQGPLIDRVMASCAIPGIFPPLTIDGDLLSDGSWINPIPVSLARELGADLVIAVDVAPTMKSAPLAADANGWNISIKANEISRIFLKQRDLEDADLSIPIDAEVAHWADFSKIHSCIEAGEKATLKQIDAIKSKIALRKFTRFFIKK